MPPQVGKAGDGSRPVVTNAGDGVEDVKATETEKKSVEQLSDIAKSETAVPYKATPKEASNKKAELSLGGSSVKTTLNRQLNEKEGKTAAQPNVIYGTSGNDNVHISKAPGLSGALGLYEVNINGSKQYMTKKQLEETEFKLGAGNDTFVVDSNVTAGVTVDGGRGDDVIIGGGGDDKLRGGRGKDVIAGRGGNDRISGGKGNDTIDGGSGNDFIDGGAGHDFIQGGKGDDVIQGGSGNDVIIDGSGKNQIQGGKGFDLILDKSALDSILGKKKK